MGVTQVQQRSSTRAPGPTVSARACATDAGWTIQWSSAVDVATRGEWPTHGVSMNRPRFVIDITRLRFGEGDFPEPVMSELKTSAATATGPVVPVKYVAESAAGLSTLASVVETTLAPAVGQPSTHRAPFPVRQVGGPQGPAHPPQ